MPRTFVDSHCHLFNLVDVPLYETLDGKVRMNTVKKLFGAMFSGSAFLSGFVRSKIGDYKEFIQFFERSQEANMRALAAQIQNCTDVDQIVMTPLVMDFDCTRYSCGENATPCTAESNCPHAHVTPDSVSTDPGVEAQYRRIKRSVDRVTALDPTWGETFKVFPFIGFDLRKLTPTNVDALTKLKEFWNEVGVTKEERAGNFEDIPNGKALGIKLYPPIGFNPYPKKDPVALREYLKFYEWCIQEGIPLTVHCQSGSFSVSRKQRAIDRDADAINWLNLFNDWEAGKLDTTEDIKELRINFAHFGGENGLEDMMDWGIDDDAWTYHIVHMMKKYPHIYSDISAFDWSNNGDVKNFARIFKEEERGNLPSGEYKMSDKILWGSDVPMIVSDEAYKQGKDLDGASDYKFLMQHYLEGIQKITAYDEEQQKALINNMVEKSPTQFLLR